MIQRVCRVLFSVFSSVSSSWSNWTISLIDRVPLRDSSPIANSSLITMGEREMVFSISICQVVDLLRRVHLGREDIVHLVVEQVAALLAHVDELAYLVILFFNHQRQRFLHLSGRACPKAIPWPKEGHPDAPTG